MADVTGPISTLPGSGHDVPDGMECDNHPGVKADARVQGETDSFGCEMIDMCAECFAAYRAYLASPEAAEDDCGTCDWCKNPATDLRDRRDYEEGMNGPVYRVCAPCIKRVNDRDQQEMDTYGYDDGGW